MVVVDYSENFWGEKNLGYSRLYGNLKRNEDVVQELSVFVKERISAEEELLKFLTKNLSRVSNFISNNGAFIDSWRLTKSTLELWMEIQTTLVRNLSELSRDILRYHDEMVKARKRIKDQETIDAVDLMQTTTTCLQKAKETYLQRCSEMANLKKENAMTKELVKAKTKLTRAHEEYKMYVEKYGTVRDNFENKLHKAASVFQEHDNAFLKQFKSFMCTFARSLDDSQSAVSQVTADYRQSLDQIDVQAIMAKFIEERGTGNQRPPIIQWSEIDDEIPELDIHENTSKSAPSSSNSSAVVAAFQPEYTTPSVNDLLSIDSPSGNNSLRSPTDSESEEASGHHAPVNNTNSASSSYVPSVSSLFGRQKIAQWRKKHASQSNLSAAVANEGVGEFSQSYNESSITKSGFLRRYRKSKNSENLGEPKNSFSRQDDSHSVLSDDKSTTGKNPLDDIFSFGSLPSIKPIDTLPDVDSEGFTIRKDSKAEDKSKWSSNCSSSDDEEDETEFQTSKIKSLQIKPINESHNQIDSSVDELRNAIGHINIQRSSTFEKDPWWPSTSTAGNDIAFSHSLKTVQPMRHAFTGDDSMNRKFLEFNYPNQTMPSPNFDFSQSTNFTTGISRARPRSQMTASSSNVNSGQNLMGKKELTSCLTPFDSSLGGSFGSLANLSGWPANDTSIIQQSSSPLSFNESTSGPVSRLKIPLAMGINEYIHAWFKPSEPSKPIVRVFGVIMCSIPSSFMSQLSMPDSREPLKFTLKNASQIKTVQPHKRLIPDSTISSLPQDVYTFTVNKQALANWIFEQQQQKPNSEFYNVDLIRYELNDSFEAPLLINSYWKLNAKQTDLRIDYSLNTSEKTLSTPLINITFDTCVDGKVDSFNSDPSAKWSDENNTLTFNLTELTRHGGSSGSLKARLKLNNGPSSAGDTNVSFQTSNTTASTINLQLDSETGYQLSLVRKKVVSGKYFCKPQVRA